MELRIYDLNLQLQGIVDNATSIRWRPKYYEPGEFEIHCPATINNIFLLQTERIVRGGNDDEVGIVEGRTIKESSTSRTITITGRYIASIYDRRLIKSTTYYSGKAEEIMFSIVKNVVPFPHVTFGEPNGYMEEVIFQATYKNVLTYLEKLSRSSNIGFKLVPDFKNKQYVFQTYRGVDHSYSQTNNSRVIFSDEFANLNDITYTENNMIYKNVMYIGGQGEGSEREIVLCGDDSLTGFDRREDFFSATDISKDDDTKDADYTNALIDRGNSKLDEAVLVNSIEGTAIAKGNFEYGKDYGIGDIVTVEKTSWGIAYDERLTEIEIVYEHGIPKITPTFGTAIPESVDWSDK